LVVLAVAEAVVQQIPELRVMVAVLEAHKVVLMGMIIQAVALVAAVQIVAMVLAV
tara:strand:+ start:423 stop:587 length:165 start_codon:yes stop_codon:yes gene_type:complete